jgi:hypothetical protein
VPNSKKRDNSLGIYSAELYNECGAGIDPEKRIKR